jgi:hypothetical protein
MEIALIVNTAFAIISAYWAKQAFENGEKYWGYFNLSASAINAAAVLVTIF